MIKIKNNYEIEIMRQGGKILTDVLRLVFGKLEIGMTLSELDKLAEEEISKRGAFPSFKKVKGYNWTICVCINDVVVHGIPDSYKIRQGDVVGIDCGVFYQGFHTDAAWTKKIKNEKLKMKNEEEIDKFLKVGEKALNEALKQVKVGNYIYDISRTIQENIESSGYSVVRSLVGHGVGKELHEDPEVPGVVTVPRMRTHQIIDGNVLAVEIIYNMGSPNVVLMEQDGWTIKTKDGKISGLFEATVAATNHGSIVLSQFDGK